MFDIYSELFLPVWAILFIQSTALPWLQALATQVSMDERSSKAMTVALNVVVAIVGVVGSENGFSLTDLFMLAAPGVFIAGNAYDKVWQLFGIREWLFPEAGVKQLVAPRAA